MKSHSRKKRRVTRRRRGRFRIARSVIPRQQTVKLHYSEQTSITTTANLAHLYYRTNGIFDPTAGAGGGHQPMGHDELANLYHHYAVIGSKISVRALNKDTGDGMIVGLGVTASASGSSNLTEFTENEQTKTRMIGEFGSGNNFGSLTQGWSAKRQFTGRSPVSDSALRATFGADPTEQSFFDICAAQATYGAYGGTVIFEIAVTYIVVLIEPKTLGLS